MPEARCDRAFFARSALRVARSLLGCTLVRVLPSGERLSGRIVETEAYLGVKDRAAHSFGGRRTARTEPMFGPPGLAYVYYIYGMHWCMNVSCKAEGIPEAVLIRALEPLEGTDRMRELRGTRAGGKRVKPVDLCRGPARLCKAMGIDGRLSGDDTCTSGELWLESGGLRPGEAVARSARVGVAYAGEWAARPYRFFIPTSEFVSLSRG